MKPLELVTYIGVGEDWLWRGVGVDEAETTQIWLLAAVPDLVEGGVQGVGELLADGLPVARIRERPDLFPVVVVACRVLVAVVLLLTDGNLPLDETCKLLPSML